MEKIKLSQFIQWRFNIFLYISIGWWFAKYYIFFIGKVYFFFNRKEKKTIITAVNNVARQLNLKIDTKKTIQNVFYGIFSHYYGKMFIGFEKCEKKNNFINRNIKCDDLVVVRKGLLKGNGVIVITGHYGAIEYIPALFGLNGFNISMIAKFKTEKLKNKILSQALRYNARFIDGENSGNVLMNAIKELKQNRVLITQCDEIDEWRPSKNNRTSFLGQNTGLDRTINIIQKRTGAEVVFGVIHRISLSEYKLIIYSYEDMLKILSCNHLSIGEVSLKILEHLICNDPEQWYQWSKYSFIDDRPLFDYKIDKIPTHAFSQPSLGKAQ